jgi:hypothetical protein
LHPSFWATGESLLRDIDLAALGYAVTRVEPSTSVTNLVAEKTSQ